MMAGSGRGEMILPAGFLPAEGFVTQAHPVFVRALAETAARLLRKTGEKQKRKTGKKQKRIAFVGKNRYNSPDSNSPLHSGDGKKDGG